VATLAFLFFPCASLSSYHFSPLPTLTRSLSPPSETSQAALGHRSRRDAGDPTFSLQPAKSYPKGPINTVKGRNQQRKREGEAVARGPTGHQDAEFNSNPTHSFHHSFLWIEMYLYMVLLSTACRSLKYPLSGNKNSLSPSLHPTDI
jgi:hypothetical protein